MIYGGRVEKLDLRTMQTRSIDPTLAYPQNDRRTWTLPLVFSPRDIHVLYFANQRMFRTEDGGNHWSVISPDLTRDDPGAPSNLDPATAALRPAATGTRFGVIYAIAPSRTADHEIWAGTDDGLIWRTRDEGAHWENVTPAALTPWSKVGIIEASHFDGDTAYVAVDRHRLDDFKPYIYRTHDGGKHWDLIVNGLGAFANAVREDPVRKGLLYAGTERGVFVSFDDGSHWDSLQLNLPVTSVRDLDVHGDDLVIATHGRAFWVLDNITPLRQTSDTMPFLFKPATAVRERPAGFTGSPMPKDEAMAPNPPFGAAIDYALRATPSQPVTLEIFDTQGALVRKYSSADEHPKTDLSKITVAPEWVAPPSALSATPGMHRFFWSIRYAAPKGLGGGRRSGGDGVWAPPGNYKVVLTVDGQQLTQPLTVAPDPRFKFGPSIYAEQFTFAREIETMRAAVAAAEREAEEQIKKNPTTSARAIEISGFNPATAEAWWLAPPPGTLRFVAGELDKLAGAVDGADGPPSADARESWSKLKPMAEEALKAWKGR